MKMFIIILATVLCFSSCNKENDALKNPNANYEFGLEFAFQNESGDDLLNPIFHNSYSQDDLQVYCMDEGNKKILANKDSLHFISNERGFFTLNVNLINDTTYLKLSTSITDTIVSEFNSGTNYQLIMNVWYNGDLIWKRENETSVIKIVK